MPQCVRLGGTGEQLARSPRRHLKSVAHDPIDAMTCEEPGLFRDFMRCAAMQASAESRVFALGILSNANHVDVARRSIRQRRYQPREEAHRPQVDVLLETLAQRKQEIP